MAFKLVAALNEDGKRVPVCKTEVRPHAFTPITRQIRSGAAVLSQVEIVCVHCGAQLELPPPLLPEGLFPTAWLPAAEASAAVGSPDLRAPVAHRDHALADEVAPLCGCTECTAQRPVPPDASPV